MLSLTNLTVSTDNKKILTEISVSFRPGTVYAIMGPNGSGKSTLARTVMGDPTFSIENGNITLSTDTSSCDITHMSADKRARAGIFLSAQSPLSIPGVTVRDLIRTALKDDARSALEIKQELERIAKELSIPNELLNRSLNDGFSGGERKKMEVLQMALLNPRYIFLDEIDTGVDVDALRTIAHFLKKYIANTGKTLVMITHATRILRYLTPEEIIVIRNGNIVATGGLNLAQNIEKEGFDIIT